jgi:Flp pilus assembly protein TadD
MQMRCAIFVFLLAALPALAQQQGQPSSQDAASGKANTKQQTTHPSSPDANPFPEEQSEKTAAAAGANGSGAKQPDPGYSSSHVDMKRLDPDADRETRISNGAGGYVHDPQLAAKDEKVGKFYLQAGDFKGAYDRYREASLVAPEDGDAVFGLAEAARGLHLKEEAEANYKLYIDAFPDGKKSKDARKALAALDSDHKK